MSSKDPSKLTTSGYQAHRKAEGELKGAKPPQGIEAKMALTSPNDLKVREFPSMEAFASRLEAIAIRTRQKEKEEWSHIVCY